MKSLCKSLVLICLAVSSFAMDPWLKWTRNPLTIPVTATLTNLYALTNTGVYVALGDKATTKNGAGCTTGTNMSLVSKLQVRREYELTIVSSNLTSFDLEFDYQPNWTPVTSRGRAARPKVYRLLVDRQEYAGKIAVNNANGSCTLYTNTWTIELNENLPTNWALEDASDNEDAAPGDGAWMEMGPGKSLDQYRTAYTWAASLGRLTDGTAAGRIALRDDIITAASFTPTNLFFLCGREWIRDEVQLITVNTNSPVLRQIKACQTFIDIVDLTNSTEMRFYSTNQVGSTTNAQGHYTSITGTPFVTWITQNPNPPATNRLLIIESRNGTTKTNDLTYDSASSSATWTLKYGAGTEQRIETRGVTFITSPTTNRIETVDVRYAGATTPAYKVKETYQWFGWGFELIETRIDPDDNATTDNDLVTTFHFNTDYINHPYAYGKPDYIKYPDGFWEKRNYDEDPFAFPGALLEVFTPHLDSPADPNDATIDNAVRAYYDQGEYREKAVTRHYLDDSDSTFRLEGRTREPSDGGMDYSFDGANWDGTSLYVGPTSMTWDDYSGFGYAGHEASFINSRDPDRLSGYHGGTLSGSTFTGNGTDPWDGPDWRKSTIFGGPRNDGITGVQYIYDLDGDPITGGGITGGGFYANETWRENEVFHNGSLALKELLVFTGNDEFTGEPQFELINSTIIQNDSLGHATNITILDAVSGAQRVVYEADYKGASAKDGDLKLWEKDETGIKISYTYDSLKRVIEARQEGITAGGGFAAQTDRMTTTRYDAATRVLSTIRSGGGTGSPTTTNLVAFDLAGRVTSQTDTNALTTTFLYDQGGKIVTTVLPSGRTEVRENYLDRRLKSVTGTGVAAAEYHNWEYSTNDKQQNGWGLHFASRNSRVKHEIRTGTSTSTRLRIEAIDWFNKTNYVEHPDWNLTDYVTERWELIEPMGLAGNYPVKYDLPFVKYCDEIRSGASMERNGYDFAGRRALVEIPLVDSGTITNTRRTLEHVCYTKAGGCWFLTTSNLVCRNFEDDSFTVVQVRRERQNGFSNGAIVSEVTTTDADGNDTVVTETVDRTNKTFTETSNTAQSTLDAVKVAKNGLLVSETTATFAAPKLYAYDALGRQTSETSPLGFTAQTIYNSQGRVAATVDVTGLRMDNDYYTSGLGAGQLKSVTLPGGKTTFYAYTNAGVWRIWGNVPYPEERLYNQFGDMVELHTYRGGAGWEGSSWPTATTGTADVTTCTYQEETGLLVSKNDSSSKTVGFTYWQDLPLTRTLARGVSLTNEYNDLGELLAIHYDANTPAVLYTNGVVQSYSRTGKPLFVHDGSGDWDLQYDYGDRLTAAMCTTGSFSGITISNRFNSVHGKDRVYVSGASSTIDTTYGFDLYGRINSVTSGSATVDYGYASNSDLLASSTFRNSGTMRLTTTRAWDYGMRLRSISNAASTVPVSYHSYTYDPLSRRNTATLGDNSFWQYDYNDRDEVIGGHRFWSDFTPVSGQQFQYSYDTIGNRASMSIGGNVSGGNLRTITYAKNGLNEYTSVTTAGFKDIVGVSYAANTVTVNAGATDRKGEYFHAELSLANSTSPIWQSVAVVGGGTTQNGALTFPKNSQTYTYDDDGNVTFDGIWTYQWDAENRLIQMTMTNVASVPDAERKKLVFGYDNEHRRISKKVYLWNGTAFSSSASSDLRFIYDNWNLQGEIDASGTVLRRYAWGLDLSGDLQTAGGIGGLVAMYDGSANYFPGYDGNGNVTTLIKGDGTRGASYEYGPFGELIRQEGTAAKQNPFRWSTKYCDEETQLNLFGYRYYSATLGRWLGRDPKHEQGGLNLFAFVRNGPVNRFDPLGLEELVDVEASEAIGENAEADSGISAGRALSNAQDFADKWNDFQEIFSLVLDSAEGDPSDILGKLWNARQEILGMTKSDKSVDALHHVFTQKARGWLKDAGIDTDKFTVGLSKMIHRKLHSGKGFGRGGMWNWLWKKYTNGKTADKMSVEDIKKFEREVSRFFGIDDRAIVPYR